MTALQAHSVGDALERATRALQIAGSECARIDAALLMGFATGRSRAWFVAHAGERLDAAQTERFDLLVRRRASGVPVAYLVGSAWFCGREFRVDERVLIPRPESEHLAEDAIALLRASPGAVFLDVGTGSGAIACTVAAEVAQARVDATDLSAHALTVAQNNAARLQLGDRVAFHLGDLLAPVRERAYDVVVANLPYVPSALSRVESLRCEPRLALDGGRDGLAVYRRLLPDLSRALLPGGIALLEAAPPTIEALAQLAHAAFAQGRVTLERDYGGRPRYVKVASSS